MEEIQEIANYFNLGTVVGDSPLPKGLVNTTQFVTTEKGKFVLQKLNSIFDERVIDDNLAICNHLTFYGITVPRIVQSPSGALFVRKYKGIWRVYEYIENDFDVKPNTQKVCSAAELLGRFHTAIANSHYLPKYSIPDFHDSRSIARRLAIIWADYRKSGLYNDLDELCSFALDNISKHFLPEHLNKHLIHGDPKFDNFLFKGDKAIAIVDFDTIMLGSRLVDIGDGLRSWCRRDVKRFDIEACREIIVAYNSNVSDKISLREALNSTALITLELAVRFLIDCFEESYFEWDKSKYRNAREHNKIRAIQMIDYYKSIVSFI